MIRFNLSHIINKFLRQHPNGHWTITELAREIGISRHALNTLCGKSSRPKGINFDTLNRLVNFFRLPVNAFIKYMPSGMKITLKDASDVTAINGLLNSKNPFFRTMIRRAVYMSVDMNEQPIGDVLLTFPRYISNKDSFILHFSEFNRGVLPKFKVMFQNNLTDQTKHYIYARILAHSGLLTKRMANHANELTIAPTLNNKATWNITHGLKSHDILNRRPPFKNSSDDSTVVDKTSNQFKE